MARVLVTGGTGFVGLRLVKQLVERSHDVAVLDSLKSGPTRAAGLPPGVRFYQADIADERQVGTCLSDYTADAIVHLAAIHFIPECNREPVETVRVNVLGTENVLRCCRRSTSIRRVIVTSSAAVYAPSDRYVNEDERAVPTDVYGLTKATNEVQARQYSDETGICSIAVRLFNVFGPGETNPHVIPAIIDQLKLGRRELQLGNTTPKRSYVHVDDAADGFARLLTADVSASHSVYNLGVREEASVDEVIATIGRLMGCDLSIERLDELHRQADRGYLRCNPERLEMATGWRPRYTLETGLRHLLSIEGLIAS